MEGARHTLEAIPERTGGASAYQSVALFEKFRLELFAGNYQKALDMLAPAGVAFDEGQWWFVPRALLEGWTCSLMGDAERARSHFESARNLLESEVAERPEDYRVRSSLGIVYANLGRKEDAIREGELAVKHMSVEKNAVIGPFRVEDLASIYAVVGEHDKALDLIEYLLSIPSWISVPLLRLDPKWDSLRESPRFRSLLEKESGGN